MIRSKRWIPVVAAAGLLGLYAAAVAVGAWTRPSPDLRRPDVIALPSHSVAQVTALGFDTLLADFYLLRSIQYFGESVNGRDNYAYLFPLLDLVSELDPRWPEPLLWGGIAIQRNLGRETWINTAESTRLLRKGTERFPDEWRFPVFLAYNLSTFHNDNIEAARVLEKAVKLPGRPSYVPALVTRLYASAGDLNTARALAATVGEQSADPDVQQMMKERLVDLDTEERLRSLDEAIARFRETHERPPRNVQELVEAGVISALPPEPRGASWYIAENGEAMSTAMTTRLRVHRAPKKEKVNSAEESK